MEPDHHTELLKGFRASNDKATRMTCSKLFSMTDAEDAYRNSLSSVFGTSPLMCWFHVKSAANAYIEKNGLGNAEAKCLLWSSVAGDLDALHNAQSAADFKSRWAALRAKWDDDGVPRKTSWQDKKGTDRDFVD